MEDFDAILTPQTQRGDAPAPGGSGDTKTLVMNRRQQGILVNSFKHQRDQRIQEGKLTEDVDELLLKAIDAPPQRKRRWLEREGR
jgi:hypothetical protein